MNKPTLNVLGRKHKIVSVEVEVAPGETKYYYDGEYHELIPADATVNLANAIENPTQTERLIERYETTIADEKNQLMNLKMDIVENVIENIDLPFPDEKLKSLVDDIKSQTTFIEALEHSLDIAKNNHKWGFLNDVSEVPSTDA